MHLDAGRIVETSGRFQEGVTKTTARLQGVRRGGKLVLIDAYAELANMVRDEALRLSRQGVGQCRAFVLGLDKQAERLQETLHFHDAALRILKTGLRSRFV